MVGLDAGETYDVRGVGVEGGSVSCFIYFPSKVDIEVGTSRHWHEQLTIAMRRLTLGSGRQQKDAACSHAGKGEFNKEPGC